MASFRDYEAVQTATVELFHGESLQVRSVSSPEFMIKALPIYREKAVKDKMTIDEETKYNISITFALVESWSFNEDLTLENFIDMLQSPARSAIAGQICKLINDVSANMDNFVKKKSVDLSNGSSETGSLTDQPETAQKPAAKRLKRSTNKPDASRKV